MENRTGYTVPLALEDFVPVVLGVAGGSLLVRAAASRVPRPADVESRDHRPGAGCCWGGSKALWKPIVEAEGSDVRLLEQVLFPLRGQAEQTLALHSTLQSINTVGRAA